MQYSIVIPCYKSADTISKVVELTAKELENLEHEFILVNDASPDGGDTINAINNLADKYSNVTAIDLAKNSGQHNAILCGLKYTSGEYIICMDDDMQTHPSQIHILIDKIKEGYDIVYASYPNKKHSLFRRLGSSFNSFCERVFIGKPKNLETNSYWIMKQFVRDYLIKYSNAYTYLDGLVMRTTRNIANVPVKHFERESGTSGYTLGKLISHWFDIIGFTVAPLKAAFGIGLLTSLISVISAIVIIVQRMTNNIQTTGWSSLMVALCFFSGVILIFMGVIGEYIGRLFQASNNEPQYVIRSVKGKDTIND